MNRSLARAILAMAAAATLAAPTWGSVPTTTRAGGPTSVSGIISADTTWALANSPYIVTGHLLVSQGVTLTIEPGVTVKFDSGKTLQVNGTLIARGSGSNRITFTSNQATPAAGDWGYIFFTDFSSDASYAGDGSYLAGSILEHSVIEYGGGVVGPFGAYALGLDNASPFINYATIRNNSGAGINARSRSVKISNSIITGNGGGVGATLFGGSLSLSSSTISNNGGGGVGVSPGGGVATISQNTIQNNGSSGIGADSTNGTLIITNNTIRGNKGAGIWLRDFNGPVTISGNLIADNSNSTYEYTLKAYGLGGGVFILRGDGGRSITNNIILRNAASGTGGGVYVSGSGGTTISGNILAENSAATGGGLYLSAGSSGGTVTATVSLNQVARNSASRGAGMVIREYSSVVLTVEKNTIRGNTASGTGSSGVYWEAGSSLSASAFNANNLIANTAEYHLYSDRPNNAANLNATNNWWGTTSESDIQARIYDWNDDFTKGIVDYSPYLTSPNTAAPISPPTGLVLTPGAGTIALSWAANPEADTAGYKAYYDTDSGYPYTGTGALQGSSPIDVGNVTTYTLTGLPPGTYYLAITAYDTSRDGTNDQTDGNESWFSQEVTGTLKIYLPLVARGLVGGW